MLEFQQFQDKIRRELRARMKFSKDLLELRDKEAKLVRMKRYEEAEKVKMKADLLEEFERNKLEAEVSQKKKHTHTERRGGWLLHMMRIFWTFEENSQLSQLIVAQSFKQHLSASAFLYYFSCICEPIPFKLLCNVRINREKKTAPTIWQ